MGLFDLFRKGTASHPSLMDDLDQFYKQHRQIVASYFYKVTRSVEECEELTQETFYQAVKSIHRFKGNSSLKTWLLQIARNVYRNRIRTLARDHVVYATDQVDLHGDETLNPQRISMQKHARKEIRDILEQLPEDYRDVLIFKEIEGLSHVEIAQILQKTPQTTKVLLYRAKKRFRELYQD